MFSPQGTGLFQRAHVQISNVCENQEKKYIVFRKMYKDEKAKVYLIFFCKKFYCFRLIQCMGEGSRVVKMIPSGCRKKLRQKPDTREMQRGPSKALGLQRLLVVLEGEPLEEMLVQPSLGTSQPLDAC